MNTIEQILCFEEDGFPIFNPDISVDADSVSFLIDAVEKGILSRATQVKGPLKTALKEFVDTHNCQIGGSVFYLEDALIIRGADTNRNWQYYAGFQYLDADTCLRVGDLYIYREVEDRVSAVLLFIQEFEEPTVTH